MSKSGKWFKARIRTFNIILALSVPAVICGSPVPGLAQESASQQKPAHEALLEGATEIGIGAVAAYFKNNNYILAIPGDVFDRPMIWYAEAVGLPGGRPLEPEIGSLAVRFEKVAGRVLIRDLTTRSTTVSGAPGETQVGDDLKITPIEAALDALALGPVLTAMPIAATRPDGTVLVDFTKQFSTDIPGLSVNKFFTGTPLVPAAVDPSASYIDRVQVFGRNLHIRSHVTTLAKNAKEPQSAPVPVSFIVGHSLVLLPDEPMKPRYANPRVGYFTSKFSIYEAESGETSFETRDVIARFRLEKENPGANVSDPLKPIVFHIGPGVPERWRPYVKAGVEEWRPVFEAAGFSNAIMAVDAPGPDEDPNFSVEDVSRSMIRWLPQPKVNAMGPHVIDPRSGETLSSHVLVWPSVIDGFASYYFSLFSSVDPRAGSLPLPEELRGRILQYAVAHEVGHAIGLRHNQAASTVWSIEQLRDPEFANRHGPNGSIMAYGRFNQAAQPGDGITQLYGVVGAYDYAAIKWGYGDFGDDPDAEQAALDEFARRFSTDRELLWGAAEGAAEREVFSLDPRIQIENVSSERIAATKLGVANTTRTLARLDEATNGDDRLFREAYEATLSTHMRLLKSVSTLIGGTMYQFGENSGPPVRYVPAEDQRQAVFYLLGEGARSLEPFQNPSLVERVAPIGGYRFIDQKQAELLRAVMNHEDKAGVTVDKIGILESQSVRDDAAYSPLDLGKNVASAVWGELDEAPFWKRALQRAYIAETRKLLDAWAKGGQGEEESAKAFQAQGLSEAFSRIVVETGDDSIFPAWIRSYLPGLQQKLQAAGQMAETQSDRLHFFEMAVQVDRLIKIGR